MREELSRRDLCVRLLAGGLLGGAAPAAATTTRGRVREDDRFRALSGADPARPRRPSAGPEEPAFAVPHGRGRRTHGADDDRHRARPDAREAIRGGAASLRRPRPRRPRLRGGDGERVPAGVPPRGGAHAQVVGSVCTGALVLAATGLLEGRRATTHWAYAAELEMLGARYVRERYVEDGKFITGGGVSAGIDMAIALAARLPIAPLPSASSSGSSTTRTRPSAGSIGAGSAKGSAPASGKVAPASDSRSPPQLLAGRPDLLARLGLTAR